MFESLKTFVSSLAEDARLENRFESKDCQLATDRLEAHHTLGHAALAGFEDALKLLDHVFDFVWGKTKIRVW